MFAEDGRHKLLLVDDDPIISHSMRLLLSNDYDVMVANSRAEAQQQFNESGSAPSLALVDLGLPPVPHTPDEGFALIRELLAQNSSMKILVLSGQDDRTNVQHALTLGAVDFIPKPCDAELLKSRLQHQVMLLDAELGETQAMHTTKEPVQVPASASTSDTAVSTSLVGESLAMQALNAQIQQFANAPFPVLIEGDSGTGKELIARELHVQSQREAEPYLVINCAAFTKDLLEAQLFGHTKGAFTGAAKEHAGFFEEAKEGTLFMDEIGDLPLELQAKLLRVLENGEYYRLGETKARQSNARIVAATNRNLVEEVREGRFRQDLYHRLSILSIKVPSLAERGQDRLHLLHFFQQFYTGTVSPFSLDDDARQVWLQYGFPGNVRELRNLVIRLGTKYPNQIVTPAQIQAEMEHDILPESQSDNAHSRLQQIQQAHFALEQYLLDMERDFVTTALDHHHGNLSQAAKMLKMNRTTLYSRLDKLGLK